MTRSMLVTAARYALFAALLFFAATIREAPSSVVDQAIIWLPTGVAMAGLCLLGLRAWWVVGLLALTQRLLGGYEWSVALPAVAGSSLEAVLGVLMLRRLGFDRAVARLRDVAALLAAAAVAPLGSILCSYLGRLYLWSNPDMPFYSGWDGWWRMNALGVLTVVPVALVWFGIPRREVTPRLLLGAALALAGIPLVLGSAMVLVPPGTAGILWLNLVFGPIVLYAAARFGMRGATLASTLAALVVAVATTRGYGPFLDVAREQRHVSIQLFELMFVALPPAFGALIAERRAAQDRGVRSDELRRSIQSALPDITYQLRRDGTCLDIAVPPGMTSPAPRELLLGRSVFDLVPPAQAAVFRDAIERTRADAAPALLEYEIEVAGRRLVREARCVAHGTDEVLVVVRDITDRKWAEGTMVFEARVLELVAAGRSPAEVFEAIVRGIEALTPGGRCSIIVLDGRHMHVAMAPSLPGGFNAAVEGLEIGPMVGSCGAAASTGRVVVVRDIGTSPLWAPYRDLVLGFGLHACWSVPIRDSNGAVLGTFAVYYGEPREPDARDLQLAERAGALAGIVLEREQRSGALRRSEDLLASINRNVKEGIFRSSREGRALYANLALARMFGFETPEELLGFSFADAVADPERGFELANIAREHGQWLNEEVECRRPDGSTFWG
ncbi:MAG: MASE1 domain-containing protein, partial [Candidatus Eisenbacteria bacterium]|nr:MASE1 domain-containing protein [Candidatus Eisenbacteria bacterium]